VQTSAETTFKDGCLEVGPQVLAPVGIGDWVRGEDNVNPRIGQSQKVSLGLDVVRCDQFETNGVTESWALDGHHSVVEKLPYSAGP